LGFTCQRTSKVKVPLDSSSFIAARARYFQTLDELRSAHVHIYYHDETWVNLGDVKRSIWVLEGKGRIRQSDSKGELRKRWAVSALISPEGYHLESVDIFACSEDHNMNSERFIKWITDTSIKLRIQHGDKDRIALVLDNAPWHNVLTPESVVPKRSWCKKDIQKWLEDHNLKFNDHAVKAELLELAVKNATPKEFKTDVAAAQFSIEIVRLPYRHSTLNPIELSWNTLKQYVRDNNTTYRSNDVYNLITEYMASVDKKLATSFFAHVEQVEQTFIDGDSFVEKEIEPDLVEESTDTEDDDEDE
ncbi:unnamed protein product, partial [Rotaria sp. Silwood1]